MQYLDRNSEGNGLTKEQIEYLQWIVMPWVLNVHMRLFAKEWGIRIRIKF